MFAKTLYETVSADLHDLSGAQAWMTSICGPHLLRVGKPSNLRFRHTGRKLETLTLGRLEYGTDTQIDIAGANTLKSYSLSLPDEGSQELFVDGLKARSNPSQGLILGPGGEQHLIIDGTCKKLQIAIPVETVSSTLEGLLNRPVQAPVKFSPVMDALEGGTGSWWRMVKNLFSELSFHDGLLANPNVAMGYSEWIVRGLLISQPSNYSREIEAALQPKIPSYMVRAKTFIELNCRNGICLEDIEAAAAIPRYKLFESFRKYLGIAPMTYLKQVRLLGVRRDLLKQQDHRNVAEIATAWGFTHLGRFSSDYRKMFDEVPSQTMSRHAPTSRH